MRMRFPPNSQLKSQLTYYVRGDESRRAQNAIIEFAVSLKMRKRDLFATHLMWAYGIHCLAYWYMKFGRL